MEFTLAAHTELQRSERAEEFTLAAHTQLLKELTARGYRFVTYADVRPDQPHVIVRHDVDMDLDRAVMLAEEEARIGVQAHYYVLLRTEMYNIFSKRSNAALRRLMELGHQVGLHFDASLYPQDREILEAAAERECEILGSLLGKRVETITFHRPAPQLQGLAGLFAGRLHGYDPRFFSDIGYCSDSEGRWRFGHPLKHESIQAGRALQLVTHPIWWCALPGEKVENKLQRFLLDVSQTITREVALNCKPYRAFLKEQVIDL